MSAQPTVAALMTVLAAVMVAGTHGRPDGPATFPVTDRPMAENFVSPAAPPTYQPPSNGSADGLKHVMWKRCMSKNYVTCVKLALVHLVDRLEKVNESYSLAPGVTVSSEKFDASAAAADDSAAPASASAGRDSSEAFDRMLVDRLGRYFSTLTLNVKLLDDATVRSVRKLADESVQFAGRGKKQKYAQSILLAGWVTGAMLLVLGMKAIAVLAGKALMTALMSLLLSGLASFRGSGHSEPKSTTYEIVTKPVYTHSHATAEDTHAAGTQNNPTYRRSIGGGVGGLIQHAAAPPSSEEAADHVVYRIHASDKTPIYIPIERRRRR